MSTFNRKEHRVLAIDPNVAGFGYVVFEGSQTLIEWGTADVQPVKNTQCLKRIAKLLDRYAPTVVIVEDYTGDGSRRCLRVQKLINAIVRLASRRNVRTRSFSRGAVRRAFADTGAFTKEQIAGVIAARHPELLHRLPPPRKLWMPEDVRMSIFDAAALAQAFFHSSTIDAKARLKRSRKAA